MRKHLWLAVALLAALCPPAAAAAAPGPQRALILVYHGIGPHKPYWVTPQELEADFLYLRRAGYHPVSLEQVAAYATRGAALPTRPVLITFDDGNASIYRYAVPLTRRYKLPAAAFVIGSRIGKPAHLSASQLRAMQRSGLWSIGAHTYDMHRFTRGTRGYRPQLLNPRPGASAPGHAAAVRRDIAQEAAAFRRAGLPRPYAFAFPFGQHDETAIALLHEAYPVLFDSRPGLAQAGQFLLPRVDASAHPLPQTLRAYAAALTREGGPYAGSPSRAPRRRAVP